MANPKRYAGTVVEVTVDGSNATITLRIGRREESFWTNDYNIARHLESFLPVGTLGYVNADPSTHEIVGAGTL
jgi:hypothetical protein